MKWTECHLPDDVRSLTADGTRLFIGEGQHPLKVLVSRERSEGWHLSISHSFRYPTWDEIVDARYALLPDGCTVGMFLPPKAEYVNVHPNCFHLFEHRPERAIIVVPG